MLYEVQVMDFLLFMSGFVSL